MTTEHLLCKLLSVCPSMTLFVLIYLRMFSSFLIISSIIFKDTLYICILYIHIYMFVITLYLTNNLGHPVYTYVCVMLHCKLYLTNYLGHPVYIYVMLHCILLMKLKLIRLMDSNSLLRALIVQERNRIRQPQKNR